MVSHAGNTSGAILRGIDPGTVDDVLTIRHMFKGTSVPSLDQESGGLPTVIVGKELARQIAVHQGDILTLVSPEGRLTPLGRVPNTRKYRIAGLFDSGMYEYDASMVYISIRQAEAFLGLGGKVTGIEVKVDNLERSDSIARDIQKSLGYPYWTKDWKMMNRSLFAALKLEKVTMFVILTMIVLVGALNIISTLVMVVMEKSKDIAILRTMGASARSVMSIFMLQGLFVGVLGTMVGLGVGLGLCHLLAEYKFISLPSDVYYISTLPVLVETSDVVLVSLAAVAISFLATLYPSWYASRLNPVEALRYE
jgi:lipoprotein-releasing system permease protein